MVVTVFSVCLWELIIWLILYYSNVLNLTEPYLDVFSSLEFKIHVQWAFLKGHSQLVHMRITYHSIANLHVTETR